MAIDLVTRAQWGAHAPRGSYGRLTSTRGVKVHYTGGHVDLAILGDHSRCIAAVRGIQNGHMDGNGWIDIGYSAVVCPHRKVFEGRGLHHLPAANGPGLNSDHYAVLGLVGTSGVVMPTPNMLHGIRDAIEWLRAEGGAGAEIKGHRDGYSTDCPGEPLYAWVQAGAPRPATTTPPVEPPEEEEVPEVVSLGLEDEVVVPSARDYQPWWTAEYRDSAGWHPAGGQSIAPDADVWADLVAFVALRGLTPGEAVEIGFTRHLAEGTLVDVAWPTGRLMTVHADADGRVEANLGGHLKLSAANRGRVTIRHSSANTVTLEVASAFKGILHCYA
ncbi:peptidoglycan recognition family protein [Streptosporangium sp. NPDC051023]|uniref:peptidoglycan recognition protein family protein n=1 Tax=Streptosporangium sp. NPDC051023 TaxID=3155410 RepID=UPI003450A38C